ncbi:MAG: hypothetical protein ACYTHK_11620 [Planctomycetota bacterium]
MILLLLAAAGGIALLMWDGGGPGERKGSRDRETGPGRENVVVRPQGLEPLPAIEEPDKFVAVCRNRGAEVVPMLLRRLRLDKDEKLLPRWVFKDGRLVGHPTKRSVYIAALAAVPGESAANGLLELMTAARSAEEAYQIAIALRSRDLDGWSGELLDRAAKGTAANQRVRMEMAAFAAKADPGGTAAHVFETAPRGDSTDDGRVLATAVTALPAETAVATTGSILDDAGITYRAKGALVRTLLRMRPESSVLGAVEEQILAGRMDERLRVEAAHAAANSIWFVNDRNAYQTAVAAGDTAKADAVRRRFEERVRAAESLIRTALGEDEKRIRSILAVLEAHKKRFN